MKARFLTLFFSLSLVVFPVMAAPGAIDPRDPGIVPRDTAHTGLVDVLDELSSTGAGIDLFESEIDDVIFSTNAFLTDGTFSGTSGPFWYILQIAMALAALFSIILAANMAYKMIAKGEPFDPLKLLRVLAVALVLSFWYDGTGRSSAGDGVLSILSVIPNSIGSYTKVLYEAEAVQVQERYSELLPLLNKRDVLQDSIQKAAVARAKGVEKAVGSPGGEDAASVPKIVETTKDAEGMSIKSGYAGVLVWLDKIVIFLALVIYRIGWWGTIYCQQIILGMLTIFGPFQWAFSLLPKWEGAWAKWLIRYLTVHFYGAMLYFVGFYVLLLFDIVISIQVDNLNAILTSSAVYSGYVKHFFLSSGYLLIAAVVALKALNLVPDLAAWMIPEGETAFSTRGFGEGVASGVKGAALSAGRML